MKKFLVQLFVLMISQGLVGPMLVFIHAVDFLDGKYPQKKSTLQWDTKIPAGVVGNTIHYITLAKGTPFSKIPHKISQKRTEIGLSPDIPHAEQKDFFQNLPWKTAKATFLKSPLPGRVIHVNAQPGQIIMAGERICTIECMKMYLEIRADHTGIENAHGEVRNIFFEPGDIVENGSDLVSFVSSHPDWENIDQGKILQNKDFLIFLFSWGAKHPPPPTHTAPPNRRGKAHYAPLLEDKHVMILLYPWMTGNSPMPPNISPPTKGPKSNAWNRFFGKDNSLPTLKKPSPQNSISGIAASPLATYQSNKEDNNQSNSKITQPKKYTSIEQSTAPSLHQKELEDKEPQGAEFKDISGVSTFVWVSWLCGLVILNKLALALKSLNSNLLKRIRLRKYAFIVSAFPRTAYVCTTNCNTYLLIKKQTATNTNRKYIIKWRVA